MKRCSTLLVIREMQIKTIMIYHLIPIRMTMIKKSTNAGEDVERREPLYSVGGNVNWSSHYGEQCGGSLKTDMIVILQDLRVSRERHSVIYIKSELKYHRVHAQQGLWSCFAHMCKLCVGTMCGYRGCTCVLFLGAP